MNLKTAWPFGHLARHSYSVILADPPWKFVNFTPNAPPSRKSPGHHYRTMSFDELRRMPVAELARPRCALVMWTTQTHLLQALDLCASWGFRFKTIGAWAKQSRTGRAWAFGTGHLLRGAAEFYIIATRGNPRVGSKGVRNLIVAPLRAHSEKPDELHSDLIKLYPGVMRCEIFGRKMVAGFDVWGDEVGKLCSPTMKLSKGSRPPSGRRAKKVASRSTR